MRQQLAQQDRPIFIIGCPRSGTTLLQLMMHSHPNIAIPPETRFMMSAYHRRLAFGDLRDPARRRKLADWVVNRRQTRFYELGLSGEEVTRQIVDGPGTLGSALGIVLRAYAERFGKARWGDKRPSYFQHIEVLLRLFPDAQFVHLIRDGRDCVASLKEMPWYKGNIYSAVSGWAEAIDFARHGAQRMPEGSYHELQYEHLIEDPETTLKALCGFLGEDFDPAMCQPQHMADVAVPERKVWHARTHGEVTTSRSGSFKQRLEPWEISLCETVLADRLRAYGYDLTGAEKISMARLAAYERVAARRKLARMKRKTFDRFVRMREQNPVGAQLTDGQLALAGVPRQRTESPELATK
ncbi:sulfotransferase [Spongiactinospora sp. TRM90649]|uniref:sulfotransferase family protein n=1 Tax=Spongiactinospora sp. TRM90649 TaxID=3031114 RepID=UPI0023F82983|nr:sulfotransferase [Spongiactinospora sp. TRM90649]MDF5751393.1 sulfotransferase [Spongiactinospora sp. TRM90649]